MLDGQLMGFADGDALVFIGDRLQHHGRFNNRFGAGLPLPNTVLATSPRACKVSLFCEFVNFLELPSSAQGKKGLEGLF